jgi:exocyst complex component 3
VKKAAKLDAAAKFKSVTSARTIKHYRSTLTETITGGIKAVLSISYEQNKADPEGFFGDLKWIYEDILDVQDLVSPCFPESYDIYSLYVRGYHKGLDDLLKSIVNEDPDAKTILVMNAWVKQYKKTMLGNQVNVPPELIEPPLLDGKEKELIQDYSKLIVRKMDQWTAELMKTETNDFVTREQAPENDSDGNYGMQGAIILFKMFNEQADAAADSGQGAILSKVVSEAHRIMRNTQDTWTKLIDSEYKKQVEKPEEVPGGLAEYVMALANDQIKCADFAEEMSARLEAIVSEKYKKEISDKLNDAIDGYLDVATKKCVTVLIDLIFNDLKPAVKQLFTATWYDGVMGQIILTIRDYMNDYQAHLNPSILALLVEELLDTFIVIYLTALGNSSKVRMPATIDRIKDDVREAFQYFATLKPSKELERTFDVVDLVLGLLEASRSMAFLANWDFAKVHGPNIQFVEAVMKAREDLDRTAVSEVMESIRRKVKDEDIKERE